MNTDAFNDEAVDQHAEIHGILSSVERVAEAPERIANQFAPHLPDIVGTGYVVHRLAYTQEWITDMIRPKS